MVYALLTVGLAMLVWLGTLLWVEAGQLPRGQRLERVQQSPQWADGEFHNQQTTPQFTGDKSAVRVMWDYLFSKIDGLSPSAPVPAVKTNLKSIGRDEEVVVWLGHSSVFVQTAGKRFLFDPVLTAALPVTLFMRPFKGADAYAPADIPPVDFLIITHDHWDHLDYRTVKALRRRVGAVVCPLGVGQHFEYWGWDASLVHEMDWGDSLAIDSTATLRCLPARHFSGRLLGRNRTLWASYLIDGARRIYVSGDGGYDGRFAAIGRQYPGIDLAIMENGQYNTQWRYIHMMPQLLPQAVDDLGARWLLTYHNSKYALARHRWNEPLDSIAANARGHAWQLLTPRIGQPVSLGEAQAQEFEQWWSD